MRRPAFQFYPGDWKTNANLRRCSWAARGVWIEVMGLMHDSDTYGVLFWPLREIAQAVGCPAALVRELVDKGVMRGADRGPVEAFTYTPRSGRVDGEAVVLLVPGDGPIWYSSRMVKDEYLRGVRGSAGRFGCDDGGEGAADVAPKRAPKAAPETTSKPSPKGGLGDGSSDGPSSSSSSSEESTSNQPLVPEPPRAGFEAVCAAAGLVVTAKREAAERAVFDAWVTGWTGCDIDRDIVGLIRAELPRRKGATSSLERFGKVVLDARARALAAKAQAERFDHSAEAPAALEFRKAAGRVLGAADVRAWLDPCRVGVGEGAVSIVAPSPFHADYLRSNFTGLLRQAAGDRVVTVGSAAR